MRSDLRRAGRLRVHRFWVVDGRAGTKLEHAALTPLSLAGRDAVVDPGLWAKWHGAERARRQVRQDLLLQWHGELIREAALLGVAAAAVFYSTVGVTPAVLASLGPGGLAALRAVAGPLFAYAVAFNALPAARAGRW